MLSQYVAQSPDLTYLELEEFLDLPQNLTEAIENNKKITHLKLLQVGPSKVVSSTIRALAANLVSCAIGEADLTTDQFLELLTALPTTLKELRLSSSMITSDLLGAPEISELLNNISELDLTNCISLTAAALSYLVASNNIIRIVLTGCTGISDQDFYTLVYKVPSKSLQQIVTRHGNEEPDLTKNIFWFFFCN